MVTPIEIQNKSFKSGGLGYDKKDVDGFLKEVLKSYEAVYRENMELNDKLAVLNDRIQYYKTIEKTLQKALVLAEKTAEDTKNAALKNAKTIENEAIVKAQLIVSDAKNERDQLHNQTIQLVQQYEKYKAQFKNLAKAQVEVLESDSFSINVANLDAFISTRELESNAAKFDSVEGTVDSEELDSIEMYTQALQEASAMEEDVSKGTFQDLDEKKESEINMNQNEEKDGDGFDFINLEEE